MWQQQTIYTVILSDFTIVLMKKFTNQIYEKAATYC